MFIFMRERYEYYSLGHGVLVSDLILECDEQLENQHQRPGATANCPYDAVRLEYGYQRIHEVDATSLEDHHRWN